jgi:hypothetical protein
MHVGRHVRAWAQEQPALTVPLIALAQELERSARSSLLTLAHGQPASAPGASHGPVMTSRRPGALG